MANEKLLIDANEVLKGIETFMQCYAEKEKELTPFWVKVAIQALDMVRQLIKKMPAVDAVEVVRCKDCVHNFVRYGENECYCGHPDGLNDILRPNDFCSYGERREGE